MRSRLSYTLAFWLLAAVALSTLAMGGLTAWNLRQGFSAYLQVRDLERLDRFVGLVGKQLATQSANTAVSGGADAGPGAAPARINMRALLYQLALLEGEAAPLLPAAQAERPMGPPPRVGPPGGPSEDPSEGGPPRRPPDGAHDRPPGGPPSGPPNGSPLGPPDGGPPRSGPPGGQPLSNGGFGSRVALAFPDGRHWAGPRFAADAPGMVERPILVNGVVAALARLRPRERAPEAHENQFLRAQFLGIAAVAAGLLLLALGAAIWLSRQWVRPLTAVQAATSRIAQGELDVRIPIERGDEFGDVVRNVNAMAESLQRIEGSRRRWLADLSHELRTPLTSLRGDLEALVDGVYPMSADAMRSLHEDVLRLGNLVDDLHALAMADLGALPCHFDQTDALLLIQQAARRHMRPAADAGLTLNWNDSAAPALPVRWDAVRVDQLLGNLLQNCLRYTDAPGRIDLTWRAQGDQVFIRVEDSAPGVAASELGRVFEPLFRADAARSRVRGGSGLGLAICEAIVRAHGGHINARASALGGLCVDITLPVEADAGQP